MFGDSNADKIACIETVAKFKTNECIIWPWYKTGGDGYGQFRYQGRMTLVHRLVCELAHGPAPKGKPLALHHCDTPGCCNPNHLYWGDHQDNARDRELRGRSNRIHGAAHHNTILVEDDILLIREASAKGATYASLAREYGVGHYAISQTARGLSWKHLGGPVVGARR